MAIQFKKTPIEGCFEILSEPVLDSRGSFSKLFRDSEFQSRFTGFAMKECLVSTSLEESFEGFIFRFHRMTMTKW